MNKQNEVTKGEWQAREGYIESEGEWVCQMWSKHEEDFENAKANIHLIVTAVNACKRISPDNPLLVAQEIENMVKALKFALAVLRQLSEEGHYPKFLSTENDGCGFSPIVEVLERIEGIDYGHGLDNIGTWKQVLARIEQKGKEK